MINLIKTIPLTKTLKHYSLGNVKDDFMASILVAIMLIPQSLAYAMLAGLPPEIGLYSSILPLVMYGIFGSSGSLAVGPVAIIALMTGATISSVSQLTDHSVIEISINLALLSGLTLVLLGWLRFGFIVNFISRSVTEGFILASIILIILSQIKHLLGIELMGHGLPDLVIGLWNKLYQFHMPTFLYSVVALSCLFTMPHLLKYYFKKNGFSNKWLEFIGKIIPACLVIISIMLINYTAIGNMEIKTIGEIPSALPAINIINIDFKLMKLLFLPALLISIIGYIESISVVTKFALKTRTSINPNTELNALGVANISSAFSGGMPVTGGFSRSVVNHTAGAKTPVSGIMTAILMAVMIVSFAEYLQFLPKALLAATIIVAVFSLFDFKKLIDTYRFSKQDFFLLSVTCLMTLIFSVETGIGVGIVASILLHLHHSSRPHIAIIGQVPGTEHFRNVCRYEVKTIPQILGLRIDERLYFANAAFLQKQVLEILNKSKLIEHCVLQFSSVSDLDKSALESLEELNQQLKEMNVELHLSEVKGPVMDKLQNTFFINEIKDRIHLSHYQAIMTLSKKYSEHCEKSDVYQMN